MSKKLTFQEIILTLQQYWNDQGCMLMQAYDNEKGAGTMSPYTFLRAIGPEPWNAAYVEPSRRPAEPVDGFSQLSSTKRISCSKGLIPNFSNDSR